MTRALVKFYDKSGKIICRLYRNGDGYPWDFGVLLAETMLGFTKMDNEWECQIANCVSELIFDSPTHTLLIAEDLGWGEDFRYDIHFPKDRPVITVGYLVLDRKIRRCTLGLDTYIEFANGFEQECKKRHSEPNFEMLTLWEEYYPADSVSLY